MTFARRHAEYLDRKREESERARQVLATPSRSLHRATYDGTSSGESIDKENPLRSEAYRRLVAALPCWFCGIEGYTQAAHADEGKGMAIKSDDRTCYPLCIDCHFIVGSSGTFTRDERRGLEQQAGRETRAAIKACGLWPRGLPEYNQKENQK